MSYIYISQQYLSDGTAITHNGHVVLGVGKTNDTGRRSKEHNKTGSKDITSIKFIFYEQISNIDIIESEIHNKLEYLGYERLKREVFTFNKKLNKEISLEDIRDIIVKLNEKYNYKNFEKEIKSLNDVISKSMLQRKVLSGEEIIYNKWVKYKKENPFIVGGTANKYNDAVNETVILSETATPTEVVVTDPVKKVFYIIESRTSQRWFEANIR